MHPDDSVRGHPITIRINGVHESSLQHLYVVREAMLGDAQDAGHGNVPVQNVQPAVRKQLSLKADHCRNAASLRVLLHFAHECFDIVLRVAPNMLQKDQPLDPLLRRVFEILPDGQLAIG